MKRLFLLALTGLSTIVTTGCQLNDRAAIDTPPETRAAGKLVKTDREGLTS